MPERVRTGSLIGAVGIVGAGLLTAIAYWLPGDLAAAIGAVVLMLVPIVMLVVPYVDLDLAPRELDAVLRPKVEVLVPVTTAAQGLWVGFVADRLLVAGLIYLVANACIFCWACREGGPNWMGIFRQVTLILTFGLGGLTMKLLAFGGAIR